MKTTYLMNQAQPDGSVGLAVVSSAEWLDAVRQNKHLPAEQQRHFIIDYIADGDELDRMVIEAPIEEYRKWHREHMASERNRQAGKNMQKLSIDMQLFATLDKGKHDKQQQNGLSTLPKTPPGCKKGGVFA